MGASHFAVALPEEGIELRLGGVEGEVLVLGAAMPRAAEDCVRYGLTQTVFTPEMSRCWTARPLPRAVRRWCTSSWTRV